MIFFPHMKELQGNSNSKQYLYLCIPRVETNCKPYQECGDQSHVQSAYGQAHGQAVDDQHSYQEKPVKPEMRVVFCVFMAL